MNIEKTQFKCIQIGYATETGNSYQLAIQTFLQLKTKTNANKLQIRIAQIDDRFSFETNSLYILFVSTTGQGDPPYAMRQFWKNIMNKNYKVLEDVKFCVYGLGDRSYGDNFNLSARKLRQRLIMLKAEQIIQIGLGDQQESNGCFQQYFNNFLPKLLTYLQSRLQFACENQPKTQQTQINFSQMRTKSASKKHKIQNLNCIQFKINQQKLLTSIQGRDMYWVTLLVLPEYENKIQQIKIGDILQIYPQNSNKVTQQMQNYFVSNNLNDINLSYDQLHQYLKSIANLQNIVNFTFFTVNNKQWKGLHQFISQQTDKNIRQLFVGKLQQLGTDYDQYFNYIKKYRRNIREVLIDFNLKIPLSSFMSRLGTIISRKYSIAQIHKEQQKQGRKIVEFSLLVKLQKFKVSSNRIINGLCSYDLSYSEQSKIKKAQFQNEKIRIGRIVRNGQFQIKNQKQNRIIMISLGTGIAPFLTILGQSLKNNYPWQLILFHSSRYLNEIPMKSQIIQPLIKQNKLKMFVTYTRQNNQVQNRRIQFIIKQNLQLFKDIHQGKIMICGLKQFCDIVCTIIQNEAGIDVKTLKKKKILCIENW